MGRIFGTSAASPGGSTQATDEQPWRKSDYVAAADWSIGLKAINDSLHDARLLERAGMLRAFPDELKALGMASTPEDDTGVNIGNEYHIHNTPAPAPSVNGTAPSTAPATAPATSQSSLLPLILTAAIAGLGGAGLAWLLGGKPSTPTATPSNPISPPAVSPVTPAGTMPPGSEWDIGLGHYNSTKKP